MPWAENNAVVNIILSRRHLIFLKAVTSAGSPQLRTPWLNRMDRLRSRSKLL